MDRFLEKEVQIITNDGKTLVGTLKGSDKYTNCILDNCEERVFSEDEEMRVISLGSLIIRGDNIACIGEIDPDLEKATDLSTIRASAFKPVIQAIY